MKFKLILGLLFGLSTAQLNAGTPPFQGCASLGCIGKLDRIYLHPSGDIMVPPMGANVASLDCTLESNVYLTLKRDHIHFQEMYSMMLMAHAAQKDIYLRTLVNSDSCEIHYAVVY